MKSGKAGGRTGQMQKTLATTGRCPVGYAPDIEYGAWKNAARQALPIARDMDELVMIMKELDERRTTPR